MFIHFGELGPGGGALRLQISAALVFVLVVSWAARTVWTDLQDRGLSWVVLQDLLGLRSICGPPRLLDPAQVVPYAGSCVADER